MKKPSSRSQRGSRVIKGKHVLQICVLLGVCIWLIYQVKYSHDKKKELYETDVKKLSEKEDGLVKLGRKDLLPGYHKEDEEEISHGEEEKESKSKVENGTHEEEEEEEDEEDKSKLGEEVVEEDEEENKHEEDDIDEQDQSKTTEDTDKDDDEETNHGDEVDMTVDEAREEHYKADDASSAVSHESSRILNTEKPKESSDNSTETTAQENNGNATVSEVEVQKEPVLKLGEAESDSSMEKSTTEVKDGDSESSDSEAKSVVTESRGESTVNGNSTEASGFLQNETRIMQERSQEDGALPSRSSELQTVVKLEQTLDESAPNITVSANVTNIDSIQDEARNSSSVIENISGSNTTEVKEITRSEGDDETGEYKESSDHFSTEQTEEADDTTSESTMLQEEREALTDPQTLRDVRTKNRRE